MPDKPKPPSSIKELIELHEGRVEHAYLDSLKYLTIGVGHLIDKRRGGKLPGPIIDALLEHDITQVRKDIAAYLPWALMLDPIRFSVLIDMTFNLGIAGLLKFTKFLSALQAREYGVAASEMLDSTWAKQVGIRALRLKTMIESGTWPRS